MKGFSEQETLKDVLTRTERRSHIFLFFFVFRASSVVLSLAQERCFVAGNLDRYILVFIYCCVGNGVNSVLKATVERETY